MSEKKKEEKRKKEKWQKKKKWNSISKTERYNIKHWMKLEEKFNLINIPDYASRIKYYTKCDLERIFINSSIIYHSILYIYKIEAKITKIFFL